MAAVVGVDAGCILLPALAVTFTIISLFFIVTSSAY